MIDSVEYDNKEEDLNTSSPAEVIRKAIIEALVNHYEPVFGDVTESIILFSPVYRDISKTIDKYDNVLR